MTMAAMTAGACSDDATPGQAGSSTTSTAGDGAGVTTTPGKRGDATAVIDPGDGGRYRPQIDPARFVERIDNRYFPLTPGASWVYEGKVDGETERIEVVVTPERRTVLGISAVVVRDTVKLGGKLIEDTFDWYAQDLDGNVWYLGEDTKEYENGKVANTKGSWEAGVNGALPGIAMPANPTVAHAYRQEYYAGEAEDLAEVVRLGATETVPFGKLDALVVTKEWTPLEPGNVEEKYYAPGVGLVLEAKVVGGTGRVQLTKFTPGR